MTKELLEKLGLSAEQIDSVIAESSKELSQKDAKIKGLEDANKDLSSKNQELTASEAGHKARAETFEKMYKESFEKPSNPEPQKSKDIFEDIVNAGKTA